MVTYATLNSSELKQRFQLLLDAPAKPTKKQICCMLFSAALSSVMILLSFSFVLEPRFPGPEGTFELTPENAFFVVEETGGYAIYVDGEYSGHATGNAEIPPGVPLYQSIEEVVNN